MYKLFFVIGLLLVIEIYANIALKVAFQSKQVFIVSIIISLLIHGFFIYEFFSFDRRVGQTQYTLILLSLLVLYLTVKLFMALPLLIEDLYRVLKTIFNFSTDSNTAQMMPSRRKFVSQMALGIAAIPFFSVLYGIFEGKYNFKVIKKAVFFEDLPDSFDGLRVLQISDLHCGSFDNKEKIEYAVDLINQQDFDLFVFTGDLVNNFAREMHPWMDTFNRIKKPKFGKYSILGNHDYGEYTIWDSAAQKEKNFQEIKDLHGEIGFKLLLNENVYIENNTDKIAVVGVENWGHNFKKAGDLNKASEKLSQQDFKILLSHDPSHFDLEVKNHPKNFHLTLSGHTHGMQFGVEIPKVFKWSPVQYVYRYWAGLYRDSGKFLYVNRGFGFHAYSGRVGIWPEITVLELKKTNKS
ncbi:MAG TPA: metallophosphoesterase [Flavobacterium sp.]|nr:metallophosphoesterase [Flavobacterium sp.]